MLSVRDQGAVQELERAHGEHPRYGVRRLAIELHWSENKTRRIRTLAGIVIPRASKKRRTGSRANPEIAAPTNALLSFATLKDENKPQDGMDYSGMTVSGGWVQDFTYIWFNRSWCYLAAVLDLESRQIVGWALGLSHSSDLTYKAVLDALSRHKSPTILHSDQGSEYLSYRHQKLCDRLNIVLSCSEKSSPWQNGFMERVFGTLKDELPPLNQLKDLAELHEAVALTIHYYNTKRIHTAFDMPPATYAATLTARFGKDNVLQKVGA